MAVVVVVGAQWGDEGKGKVVDLWAADVHMVARYAGGANAGHTLVVDGQKMVVHLLPSGALLPHATCVLGQGMVIDPVVLLQEMDKVGARASLHPSRVRVADRAHVVLPHHKLLDGLREQAAGSGAIGTTRRGIGPAYEDKAARRGVRMHDLLDRVRLRELLQRSTDACAPVLAALGGHAPPVQEVVDEYATLGERLAPYLDDTAVVVGDAVAAGRNVLLEGAQGTLLDIDHGTYPFVTSSTTLASGACSGVGIGPRCISAVVGITKAYATRVGAGPFPTEDTGLDGDALRTAGLEYGATTGRPRRCGWLDIPALRYAVRVNGLDALAITKLDVLSGRPTVPICVAYEVDGRRTDELRVGAIDRARPVYEEMPGWTDDLGTARSLSTLPPAARRYVERIAELTGCKIALVSVGADREQTIAGWNPFRG